MAKPLIFVILPTLIILIVVKAASGYQCKKVDLKALLNTPKSRAATVRRLAPSGVEGGIVTYLCRGPTPYDWWKPGKLKGANGGIYCSVGFGGREHLAPRYEVIDAPLGALSWMPFVNNGISFENAIESGKDDKGRDCYVCRAMDGPNLLLGHMYNYNTECFVTKGDKEIKVKDELELLVETTYGRELRGGPKPY